MSTPTTTESGSTMLPTPTPTTAPELHFGWCCVDCLMLLANGDTPPHMSEAETAAWLAGIDRRADGGSWDLGGEHVDGCTAWDDGTDCYCETIEFSRSPCDVCGSHLGGSRDAVHWWRH